MYNENGIKKNGIVYKEMRLSSPSNWNPTQLYSTVGIVIDPYEKTVEVRHLLGAMPNAENLFWALFGDSDIRSLISEYQEKHRYKKYKIWESNGVSGRRDIFMSFAHEHGKFATTKTMKLCHISGFGRLNEGFGDKNNKMYIGDFVELLVYLGLTEITESECLQIMADVTYLPPKLMDNLHDFGRTVSKIL